MDDADDINQCHMESIAQDAENEEIIVVDEDAEEVEAMVSVDNMKKLIKAQWKSKCSRYMQIVRESEEFSQEDLDIDNIEDLDYEHLKHEVMKILRQKKDKKTYRDIIKQSS